MFAKATRFTLPLVTLLAAGLAGGCADLLNQLQASEMAMATLVRVPDVENPQNPSQKFTGVTTFTLTFGQIDQTKLVQSASGTQTAPEGAWKPVSDAKVTLTFKDASGAEKVVNPAPVASAPGQYLLTSTEAQQLTYNPDSDYTVAITWSGKNYKMQVRPANPVKIKEFKGKNPPLMTDYAPGTAFTVTRDPAAPNGDTSKNNIAFVSLIDLQNSQNPVVWTNAPQQPMDFVQMMLDDRAWRADSFTVPGDKFAASKTYTVALNDLSRGNPVSETGLSPLFVGSQFLAGTADAGVVAVKAQ